MAKKKEKEVSTQAKKNSGFKKLFNFFSIAKKKSDGVDKVYPGTLKKRKGSEEKIIKPIDMSPQVQKAWDYFESNSTFLSNDGADYRHRIDRYQELEFMIYNEGLMYTAATIYTEEAITPDEQGNVIGINAKKKEVEKDFYNWLAEIGVSEGVLRDVAWDINVYADHFFANSISLTDGVTEITPLSPYLIQDRLEFSAVNTLSMMDKEKASVQSMVDRNKGLQDIADLMLNKKYDNYNDMYKSYLLGFMDTGGNALPPWNVSHFRRYSAHSEFFPYGRPLFIGSLARYKSFKATEMLIDAARSASFPKENYEIQVGEEMTEVEIYEEVNKIRQMIENVNKASKSPDDVSPVNDPIFSVDGLFKYNVIDSKVDLKSLGDLEAKREDLILSTNIPEGVLRPGKQSWGNSGQNLLQQSKIFARKVYGTQSPILEVFTHLYRMHLMLTDKFEGEDTDFELYMNFPVVEENSDKMRMKKDSMGLASDILSNLGDAVGLERGEALPIDVVRDVFSSYSFLNPDEINSWIDTYLQSKEENMTEGVRKRVKEKIDTRPITREIFKEAYFTAKKRNGLSEGTSNRRHYYASFNRSNKINEKTISALKQNKDYRLQEIQKEKEI